MIENLRNRRDIELIQEHYLVLKPNYHAIIFFQKF